MMVVILMLVMTVMVHGNDGDNSCNREMKVLCRFAYRLYILIHSYATKSNIVWYFT